MRMTALLLLPGLLACSNPVGLSNQDELTLQIVDNLSPQDLPHDAATITAARLEDRSLHLTVQYGGGCRTHRFAMVSGTAFGESAPPYTLFRLAHDADGDPCDALVTRQLVVDLSPIVPLIQQSGATALRFELVEPGEQISSVGELRLTL